MPLVAIHMRWDDTRLSSTRSIRIQSERGGISMPEELLDGQRQHQLVVERRQVVHAGDVGRPLDVGELLGRLLHAGVQVADDRLGAQHGLAVELDHESEHAVRRRVLGPHVDDHGLVVGLLDVDVVGVEHHALGQAQDGPDLAAQLVGAGRAGGTAPGRPRTSR